MDLDRDLPTTEADVAALRRARVGARADPIDYLTFLRTFGDTPPAVLRARPGPCADETFELP